MTTTYSVDEAVDILTERAQRYGGDISDILNETPQSMWDNPNELVEFWEGRDLSHIFPQSLHPKLANDWTNIIPEDPSVNRARGAEVMSSSEELIAEMDNELYAEIIDYTFPGDSVDVFLQVAELAVG